MPEKIKWDDIFDPDVEKGIEGLINSFASLTDSIKASMKAHLEGLGTGNPKDLAEMTEKQKHIDAILDGEKKLLVIEKEKIRLSVAKQERTKIIKEEIALAKAQEGSLNESRIRLIQLRREYDALSAAQRENVAVGGILKNQINALDKEVKGLEESTGRHQRSVGNYAKGFAGLTGIMSKLGQAFGLNTDAVESLHNASKQLISVSRELHHLTNLDVKAKEGEVAANEELAASQLLLNPLMLVFVGIIGGAIFAVANYKNEIFGLTEAEYEHRKAVDGNIIANDQIREIYNQGIEQLRTLATGYQVLTKQITEFDAQVINANANYKKSMEGLEKQTKESVEAIQSDWKLGLMDIFAPGAGKIIGGIKINDVKKDFDKTEKVLKGVLQATVNTANKEEAIEFSKRTKELRRQLQEAAIQNYQDETQRQIALLNLKFEFDKEDIKQIVANEDIKAGLIKEKEIKLQNDIADIKRKAQLKSVESETKSIVEKDVTLKQKTLSEIHQRESDELKLHLLEMGKSEEEINKKLQEKRIADLKEEIRIKKMVGEDALKEQIALQELLNSKTSQDLQEIVDGAKLLNDAILEGLQKRSEHAVEIENQKIADIDNAVKDQQDRAKEGLSNTLAFEQAERAKALDERAKLEKQQRNIQELEELSKIFLDFVDAYAKNGDTNAEAKALGKTLAVRGISKAISGGLYEGTESVGEEHAILDLNRSKDSLLVPLHKGERVMGFEDSQKIRGISNEQLVRLGQLYKYGMIDASHPASEQSQMQAAMMKIADNYKSLEQTIKNKKELTVYRNAMNELVIEEKKDGIVRRAIQKDTKIIKRG